jgi:uncharacterized protein
VQGRHARAVTATPQPLPRNKNNEKENSHARRAEHCNQSRISKCSHQHFGGVRYRKAAKQLNADGERHLGIMYAEGRGVEQDDALAVQWFRKAAEQGNADGQLRLGIMYAEGRGVKRDDATGVQWFRKAAEQPTVVPLVPAQVASGVQWLVGVTPGIADAQCSLGIMYAEGRGVKRDDAIAVQWFRKSSDQGLAEAQYRLGIMYAEGRGAKQDDTLAVQWLRKAADQGHVCAKDNLTLRGVRAILEGKTLSN